MMFYIFIYINNGLCTGLFYYLNEIINRDLPSWDPKFITSRVLGIVGISNESYSAFLHHSYIARSSHLCDLFG